MTTNSEITGKAPDKELDFRFTTTLFARLEDGKGGRVMTNLGEVEIYGRGFYRADYDPEYQIDYDLTGCYEEITEKMRGGLASDMTAVHNIIAAHIAKEMGVEIGNDHKNI